MNHVILITAAAGLNSVILNAAPPTALTARPRPRPRAGPMPWGVAGAKSGSRAGYAYSSARKASRIVWTGATLSRNLADPTAAVPGTLMPKVAMTHAEQDAFVDYLVVLK